MGEIVYFESATPVTRLVHELEREGRAVISGPSPQVAKWRTDVRHACRRIGCSVEFVRVGQTTAAYVSGNLGNAANALQDQYLLAA